MINLPFSIFHSHPTHTVPKITFQLNLKIDYGKKYINYYLNKIEGWQNITRQSWLLGGSVVALLVAQEDRYIYIYYNI